MAEPGEFTKRAFLNGRIDLSQAEAVIDLVQAKTEKGLNSSLAQLEGNLKDKIISLREKVLRITAEIEAPMDFPDQNIEELDSTEIQKRIKKHFRRSFASAFYPGLRKNIKRRNKHCNCWES